MICEIYGRKEIICNEIFENEINKKNKIGNLAPIRQDIRKTQKAKNSMDSLQAPTAPGH